MSIMGAKAGVKTWKEPSQMGSDLRQNAGADRSLTQAQKEMLGAEDLGSVLNKVADPNYVDPSKTSKGTGNSRMEKYAFFKLMLAQLKNQDPTNPLKNHEMAAQLAQFSTLEQMTNMNTTLTEIKGSNKPVEQFQALNLIGKEISGDTSKLTRTEFDKDHDFKFTLPQDAKTAEIKLISSKGDLVRTFKFAELKQGENKITWNGVNDKGQSAQPGDYFFQIEAIGQGGQKLNVKTDFTGVVSGMTFTPEGPLLQVGKQNFRLKDIRQFSDPSLKNNDQNLKDVTQLDLKKNDQMQQTHIKEEAKSLQQKLAQARSADDLYSQVGMEAGLMDKIKKETN